MGDMLGAIAAAAIIPVIALIGFLLFVFAEGEPGLSRPQRIRAMWRHLWQDDAPLAAGDRAGIPGAEASTARASGEPGQRP